MTTVSKSCDILVMLELLSWNDGINEARICVYKTFLRFLLPTTVLADELNKGFIEFIKEKKVLVYFFIKIPQIIIDLNLVMRKI